jgi:hypothetical protein
VSRLSRKCGNVNISQPYGPSRPVTGISLLTWFPGTRICGAYDFFNVYYFKTHSVPTSLIRSLASASFHRSSELLLSAYTTIYPVLVGTHDKLGPLSSTNRKLYVWVDFPSCDVIRPRFCCPHIKFFLKEWLIDFATIKSCVLFKLTALLFWALQVFLRSGSNRQSIGNGVFQEGTRTRYIDKSYLTEQYKTYIKITTWLRASIEKLVAA